MLDARRLLTSQKDHETPRWAFPAMTSQFANLTHVTLPCEPQQRPCDRFASRACLAGPTPRPSTPQTRTRKRNLTQL